MKEKALKKDLGAKEVFAISAGAMISSGLFILPAVAFAKSGPAVIVAYLMASIAVIPAMFSKTELSTAMPKSGGVYFFIARSFGPLFGVFTGFASWFSLSLKSSFALLGIGIVLSPLIPAVSPNLIKIIAVLFTLGFAALNIYGVKEAGRLQFILVTVLLAALGFFVITGAGSVDLQRFTPFAPSGWMSVITVTGLIFISFGGLTKIASISEEVRDPGKSIPRGMFMAFAVVSVLYVVVIAIATGLLPADEFSRSLMPISDAAAKITGNIGYVVMAIAAMLAFITTGNAGLLAASRAPMAMARDDLIPSALSKVHPRKGTPIFSILLTSAFMIACILLLSLEDLVKVASTMKLIMFAFVNIAVIFMRESGLVSYKPLFKSPGYPYAQIVGIIVYGFLIAKMGRLPLLLTACFIGLSGLWYLVYARKRAQKDSAFYQMVGNLTNRQLVENDSTLEGELIGIIRERDDVEEDRFDRIISNASVLDMNHTITRAEFFGSVAEVVSERWKMNKADVEKKLQQREEETSTLLYPGVAVPHAIPHIIVEGENVFDIVLARNKYGITWNEDGEVVYTAFCLIGSKDERNFHLKSLMFIAQILQDPEFHSQWMKAKTPSELRSVLLVAKRRRI